MRNLKVYRASAGSGKTFTLAVEYIKLLIQSPEAYKHIIAVTFTNKATAEMKERILSQLYGIAYGLPSSAGYTQKMREAFPHLSDATICASAKSALEKIMHDYGHFRIQTIDSFFQSVLRGLAKELELKGDVEFSLDGDELLDKAVDSYIKRLEENSDEIKQIINFIEDNLNNDRSWRVSSTIKEFAKNLLKEEYQERGEELRKQIDYNNGEKLKTFYSNIKGIENSVLNNIKSTGEQFFKLAAGYSADDFFGKSRGVWGFFEKMRKGIPPEMGAKIEACITNPDKISAMSSINNKVAQLLVRAKEIEENETKIYNSCRLALDMYHQLGLLNTIAKTLKEENERENRFLLAETTYFLSRMITNNTSFIFEKIGTEINHIFIDEFQDTSKLQWNCFQILLDEVLARGNFNLIVGDVKQSIYRWRNSDWNIMNSIENFHPETIEIASQEVKEGAFCYKSTNYRSTRRVTHFNNTLYRAAVEAISTTFNDKLGDDLAKLTRAYADVEQATPPHKGNEGYVEIRQIKKSNPRAAMTDDAVKQLMDTLEEAIDKNHIAPSDIAILIRGNSVIPTIVEAFKIKFPHLNIVSDEAYKLSAAISVQLLIAAMRHIARPDDKINIISLVEMYHKTVKKEECSVEQYLKESDYSALLPAEYTEQLPYLKGLPIYELIEKLIHILQITEIKGEEAYLFSFLDHAAQCINNKASDLGGFLEAWDDELCDKTIPASAGDSVTVTTIHKSKGLEYGTVIIPFCNWELTGRANNTLWCESKIEPFNEISLLPINSKQLMLDSIFEKDYNKDYLYQIVDNLNILYVATTRAKNNLIIFSDGDEKSLTKISGLINSIIEKVVTTIEGATYDSAAGIFTYGTPIPTKEKKKEEEKTDNPFLIESEEKKELQFTYYGNRLSYKQSRELARFLASDSREKRNYDSAARGELMHSILSALTTGEELGRRLNKMLIEGLISTEKEKKQIEEKLVKAINLPQTKEWFSGHYHLLNERAILCNSYKDGKSSYRPDRVMVGDNEVIVVDYKFAKESPAHIEQVQEYITLLKKIEDNNIKGYVWYVDRGTIVEV